MTPRHPAVRHSIRNRLTRIMLIVAGTAMLVYTVAFAVWDGYAMHAAVSVKLSTIAAIAGSNSTAALSFGDRRAATDVLQGLAVEPALVDACIYDREGQPFATYHRGGAPTMPLPAVEAAATSRRDADYLVVFRPVLLDGERIGTVFLRSDLSEINTRMRQMTIIAGTMLAAALLVAFVLSVRQALVLSRPILALAETARIVSQARDYSIRASRGRDDEVGVLVDGFNEMLAQIQQRDQALDHARQEALEASHMKSAFLANMSHEIRTPMNGIMGLCQILLETPLTAEQREHLTIVDSSARSLLHILNDILDISKIEAGRMEVEERAFDLRKMLADLLHPFEHRAAQKGIRLEWSVPPAVPAAIVSDPMRLQQVVVNVVNNAIKFTERGHVTLAVSVESATDRDMVLAFRVADTGIGIPEDKQALVFQPFTQADNSTSRRYGGSGLGLTISSRLVEMLGGRMSLTSRVGEGTEVRFTVTARAAAAADARPPAGRQAPPIETANPEAGAADRQPPPAGRGGAAASLTILLAEDNRVNQRVALAMLARLGHTVVVANNGREAVLAFGQQPFDLILMDVQMPEMDGFEATASIRQSRGGQVPILAMTAHAMKGDRERCLEGGMDGYVSKPVSRAELEREIARVMKHGMRQRPGGAAVPEEATA